MTTETTPENCIFCERPAQDFVIPNMPVCKYCMQGHSQPGNTLGVLVPPRILWQRLKVILPGIVIGLVVGCIGSIFAFFRLASPNMVTASSRGIALGTLFAIVGCLFGVLLFTLLWEIIFFSRLQHAGNDEWKSYLIEMLNLENAARRTQAKPSLVLCAWRRLRLRDLTAPMQMGILLETSQGFIFNSVQGTRAIIPFSGIAAVGTERLKMFPPRTALRLDLDTVDGLPTLKGQVKPKQIFFAFMDEKSFKANSQKAKNQEQIIKNLI